MTNSKNEKIHNLFLLLNYFRNPVPKKDDPITEYGSSLQKIVDEKVENGYTFNEICSAVATIYLAEGFNTDDIEARFLDALIKEEPLAVNNVGNGKIAGTDNNPPVNFKLKKKIPMLSRQRGKRNVSKTNAIISDS